MHRERRPAMCATRDRAPLRKQVSNWEYGAFGYRSTPRATPRPSKRARRHCSWSHPLKYCGYRIAICQLPSRTQSQHRCKRMIRRNQHPLYVVLFQNAIPARLYLDDLRICLEKILAVEVTASVEEDFRFSFESVNKVAAPLILREDAAAGVVLLQIIGGANRKHRRIETHVSGAGQSTRSENGKHQNNRQRNNAQYLRINRLQSFRVTEECAQRR